jgi:hypothetical protein
MVNHPGHSTTHKYVRKCELTVVETTPEGPKLSTCGVGYTKKYRKNKTLPYCEHHIRLAITQEQHKTSSWTHQEIELLKANYGKVTLAKLKQMLPKHAETTIRYRAYILGLYNGGHSFA